MKYYQLKPYNDIDRLLFIKVHKSKNNILEAFSGYGIIRQNKEHSLKWENIIKGCTINEISEEFYIEMKKHVIQSLWT